MNEIIGNSRTLKHDGSKIQALLRMYCGSLDSGIVSYAGNENVSDSVKYYIAFSALEEKYSRPWNSLPNLSTTAVLMT